MPKSRSRNKRSFQPAKKTDTATVANPIAGNTPVQTGRQTAAAAVAVRYPYVFLELKRIFLLTGIILVILIVCALLIPRAF